jgi:hypothetical protein
VLLAAEGRSTRSIAEEVGVQPRIVSNWRRRFAEHGLGGLKDLPRAQFGADQRELFGAAKRPAAGSYARHIGGARLLLDRLSVVFGQHISKKIFRASFLP